MSIRHHPGDELLGAYAGGSLSEGPALLVATHLALCPSCRHAVDAFEHVGGTLIEDEAPAEMSDTALDRVLGRLDSEPGSASAAPAARPGRRKPDTPPSLPQPLRGYLGDDLEALKWRSLGSNFRQHELLRDASGQVVHLLDIAPETAMPHHGHGSDELTMVLQGGFSDETGHYLPGDVAAMDESGEHQPVADPGEHCLCLAVSGAPVRLTGLLGRLLQPFLRL